MNEVMKALLERRSIRKFKPDAMTKEQLGQIVEAGLYAASGKGAQSAIAVVVTNKALRDRLSSENCRIGGWEEGFDPFYSAPAIILVLANKNEPNHVYDGSLMMGNMMLAAHALGLGSIWINRAKQEFDMPEYQALLKELGIEGEWEGIAHLAVGYIDGEVPAPAERKPGRVYWAESHSWKKGFALFPGEGFAALCASAGR